MFEEALCEIKSGFTFFWKVKNFSVCNSRIRNNLTSPLLTSEILDNSEWVLELYPISGKNVFLELKCKKEPASPSTNFQIQLFFKKSDGSEVIKNIDTRKYLGIYSMVQKRSKIFEQKELFLPGDVMTVGCRLKSPSHEAHKVEQLIARMEISKHKSFFKFPLDVPFSTNKGQQELIYLPLTKVTQSFPDFKITLNKTNDTTDALVLIKVEIADCLANQLFPVYSVCNLSLRDANGNAKYSMIAEHLFLGSEQNEIWEITFPKHGQRLFSTKESSSLTLHCGLTITDGRYTLTTESLCFSPLCPSNAKQQKVPGLPTKHSFKVPYCTAKHSFKENLKKLYDERRLCDFTIQVDDKTFPVHKTILGTVSPVFCAMFELEMEERESSLLIIKDIDSDTIQRLIDFAYTEIVADLQWDSAIKLFAASDKYEILNLKQKCAEFISSKLNVENVTDAFSIADLHQDKYLKKAAEEFIYSNSDAVLESEKWNIFMEKEMKLANTLMRGICLKLSAKISK